MYEWAAWSDDTVGVVIHALKSGCREPAWQKLAECWAARTLGETQLSPVFVPAPSRQGTRDHARVFAESLAKVWCSRIEDCLLPTSDRAQKRLEAADRLERKFTTKYLPVVSSHETLVFVDDVITTGATARAAYSALGRPPEFECWVLANRPKLVKFDDF